MCKRRPFREREQPGPGRQYRAKYQRLTRTKVPANFPIHHLDRNWENINIENLVALPHELHVRLHKYDKYWHYANGRFFVSYKTRYFAQVVLIIQEVEMWINYRDYLLGKYSLNLYNLSYAS